MEDQILIIHDADQTQNNTNLLNVKIIIVQTYGFHQRTEFIQSF
jgi:hypothetical protein